MTKLRFLFSALLATALVTPQIAEARGGFHGGRMPRMNFGGGGMHTGSFHSGGFHPGEGHRGFNAPSHYATRFHPAPGPHPLHHPPRPASRPEPHRRDTIHTRRRLAHIRDQDPTLLDQGLVRQVLAHIHRGRHRLLRYPDHIGPAIGVPRRSGVQQRLLLSGPSLQHCHRNV